MAKRASHHRASGASSPSSPGRYVRWSLLIAIVIAGPQRGSAEPEIAATSTGARTPGQRPAPAAGEAATPAPAPSPDPAAAPDGELTAAEVDGAPVPGRESGRIDDTSSQPSPLRRTLRGVLVAPRYATDVALAPLRLSVWAWDRYDLPDRYYQVFFNDARTIGLVPTGSIESGFGITAGARFVHRDLFGARESLSLEAAGGGRFRQIYKARLRSGGRFGRLHGELAGQYEQRPKELFHGIGNHDDTTMPLAAVDPVRDPTAIETRYRMRIARIAGVLDARIVDHLHVRSSSELVDREFAASDETAPIGRVYDVDALVGYRGVRYGYSELELRFDDRRRASLYEPRPVFAMGSLVAVFAGRAHRLDGIPDYWRYGIDLQHFIRIAEGPRVVALRLRSEAVSGARSEVPFGELPQLGGPGDLRGYPADRFRDRGLALGSVEYTWDLSGLVSASLFVDAGQVFESLDELAPDHLRVGYGMSLSGHTASSFGFTGSLASSIDGGVFVSLSFNPIFALDERVRRP